MPAPQRRIVVLFHERQTPRFVEAHYAVCHLARFWREAGHRVDYCFGARRFVPADLAVVHVDLSVVPAEYLELASRYPVAVNGAIADIRKSSFSRHLLAPGDAWDGPVIVKSDLNFAGWPEATFAPAQLGVRRRLERFASRALGFRPRPPLFRSAADYRICGRLADVPAAWFVPGVAVEKFLPEIENGRYCLRLYQFLGEESSSIRITAAGPVVKTDEKLSRGPVELHPDILARRRAMRCDYGKFDYVVHDGEAILLDVNKTPGHPPALDDYAEGRLRRLAPGIETFLP